MRMPMRDDPVTKTHRDTFGTPPPRVIVKSVTVQMQDCRGDDKGSNSGFFRLVSIWTRVI
jgi:hypothetical protein